MLKNLLFLLAFAALVSSCTKDHDPIGVNDTIIIRDTNYVRDSVFTRDTTTKGVLHGNVQLLDSLGVFVEDRSGVTITIPSLSLSTTTNSMGQWSLKVPSGSYNVETYVQDFGLHKSFGVVCTGPGDIYLESVRLGQVSHFRLALDSIQDGFFTSPDPYRLTYHLIAGISSRSQLIVNLSRDSSFEVLSSETVCLPVYNSWVGSTVNSPITVTKQEAAFTLKQCGFRSGEKIYVCVRGLTGLPVGISGGSQSSCYYDPTLGRWVYTALGPKSNVLTVIVP